MSCWRAGEAVVLAAAGVNFSCPTFREGVLNTVSCTINRTALREAECFPDPQFVTFDHTLGSTTTTLCVVRRIFNYSTCTPVLATGANSCKCSKSQGDIFVYEFNFTANKIKDLGARLECKICWFTGHHLDATTSESCKNMTFENSDSFDGSSVSHIGHRTTAVINIVASCVGTTTLGIFITLLGYSLVQDGYVFSAKCAALHDRYFAIKAAVKPRTKEKDLVSGSRFYYPWIILTTVNIDERSCVLSAYCACNGGIDGCCRHVLATLYEVIDFGNDQGKQSITSGPCVWVRRADDSQNVTLLTDIVTSDKKAEDSVIRPAQEVYQTVPAGASTMDVDAFFEDIKQHLPEACILHTWEKRPKRRPFHTPPLTVEPIGCQLKVYMERQGCSNPAHDDCPCCENLNHVHWSPSYQDLIEVET